MDHSYIEENQVVDRYLMGKLPADEAELFEEHYLHCGECLEALELAEKLQRGFKRAAAQEALRHAAVERLGVLAWLARATRYPTAGIAVAALLALAIVPAALLYRPSSSGFEPQINTTVLAMSPERSAPTGALDPSRVIRLSGEDEWLVLSLELDLPEHERYRVVLLRDGQDEIWRRDGFMPDHLDALVLSLHSSWLDPGDYVARVEGLPAPGDPVPVAHFSFRVFADG